MTYLPPEVSPDDEISVEWEVDDDRTQVMITLADASIIVETDPASAPALAMMAAALPQILEAAWAAIESNESQED